MPVQLDDLTMAIEVGTVAEAIEAARREAEARGRVIIEVELAGRQLRGEDLDGALESPLGDRHLRLTSTDPVALVSTSLLDAADSLDAARAEHEALAAMLQTGETAEALPKLADTLSVWQVAQDVLSHGFALLGRDAGNLEAAEGVAPVADLIDQLADQLKAIRQSLTDEDFTAVADSLSYDLGPLTEPWAETLRAAARQAASGPRA